MDLKKYIIGIDEVGRGPLAGPITVVAAAIPRGIRFKRSLGRLKDSKAMSAIQRETWVAYLRHHPRVFFALASVGPRGIEKMNISRAANTAALRAFLSLTKTYNLKPKTSSIFLDGGLFTGNKKEKRQGITLIRADQKINAVKVASLFAKVHRDRSMTRLAKQFPQYGFERHKGYGTAFHKHAIRRYGVLPVHRQTFLG